MKPKTPRLLAMALLALPMAAISATQIVSDGRLIGASGVDVGGHLYTVEFLDGLCSDLFNGCDEASDFIFNDVPSASLASQSLLDQVFLDGPSGQFDSRPTLTRECSYGVQFDSALCVVVTPMYPDLANNRIWTVKAYNWSTGPDYSGEVQGYTRDNNFEDVYTTWARWSVPEPGTLALLGLGLAGLGLTRRRKA